MRYNCILPTDIVNGVGVACTIFFQGCSHHCYNCFNPDTWDFNSGKEFTNEVIDEFIKLCRKPYVDCISITGGDVLQQDYVELSEFLDRLQPINKPIFLWSGYTYEEIIDLKKCNVLFNIDYLIDGRYIDELKDYTLHLRGSSNQRIIDCLKSLKNYIKYDITEPTIAIL